MANKILLSDGLTEASKCRLLLPMAQAKRQSLTNVSLWKISENRFSKMKK